VKPSEVEAFIARARAMQDAATGADGFATFDAVALYDYASDEIAFRAGEVGSISSRMSLLSIITCIAFQTLTLFLPFLPCLTR
jgi:hypothetical protein